ncbi:MAG: ABC transporter permease [Spirochaetales bacterium]|nr:ABC transporter permease [Spirochaetales bacterium]MCF7937852.1 ABC transporter permease [Spirochaetales bacterium]
MEFVTYIQEHYLDIGQAIFEHFYLFLVSTIIALVIGVGISILVTREGKERIGRLILSITATAQAVPSLAVIALVFLLVGIGFKPAVIALLLYSLVPIIFNASSGMLSVDPKTLEAARGLGLTPKQILWKVKVPIATPVIMAGIRSAATINIGTAAIASVIGAGGLGDMIFIGLKLQKTHIILIGTILTSALALIIDGILSNVEKKVTPKGLLVKRIHEGA